ncbi:ATP-dependent DNA helicase [Aphis craccivora]|uniref:ATP-dependent DNA helicase n=1 Tax=Aphis craccivora TaxID=307492 RepID=A0A6G0Y059_APHCR|nr:ATP-dependent DNA helicase [Aphis craccivora]
MREIERIARGGKSRPRQSIHSHIIMEVIIFCDRETATTETYSASGNVVAVGLLLRQHSAIECRRRGREKNQFPPTLPRGGFRALKINPIFVCFAHISMPTKHKVANLSRNTSTYRSMQNTRVKRNEEQIQQQNNDERVSMAQLLNRRRTNDQQRQQVHEAFISDSFLRLECPHCYALKFKNEPSGMCSASGKVKIPEIETPPEPSNGLSSTFYLCMM